MVEANVVIDLVYQRRIGQCVSDALVCAATGGYRCRSETVTKAGDDAGTTGGATAAGGDITVIPIGGRELSGRGRRGPPGQ